MAFRIFSQAKAWKKNRHEQVFLHGGMPTFYAKISFFIGA
jgi:hypothetical protein